MKLMIASDIHGSALYCEKMLERFRSEKADRLLLLGDILYHGPRNPLPEGYEPKKVFEMLYPERSRILAVRGNCDAEIDQLVLGLPALPEIALLEVNGLTIYAAHGHTVTEADPLPLENGEILLCGHTHVPVCSEHETFIFMNPGSVTMPKENTPHSYMILEGRTFRWKDLETDEVFADCTVK